MTESYDKAAKRQCILNVENSKHDNWFTHIVLIFLPDAKVPSSSRLIPLLLRSLRNEII